MAKEKLRDFDTVSDGSHAIRKFNLADFIIIFVLVVLCLTCILPFIHLAAKSISSNTAVMQRRVTLWPIGMNFDAYKSIFQDGTLILGIISAVALLILIILYIRTPDGRKYFPLRIVFIFLCAGAAGNLIDRVTLHYVRDFIYFSLIDFPVFNVADIYVTCSVFVLAYLILIYYKEEDLEFFGQKGNAGHGK